MNVGGYMVYCDDKINYLMLNKNNVKESLSRIRHGKEDDLFNSGEFQSNQPYIVSEEVFIKFLDKAKRYKQYKEMLKEIKGFIVIKENITDKVFAELLNMAQSGDDWLFLDLCHANLTSEKQKILKNLNLPETLWF